MTTQEKIMLIRRVILSNNLDLMRKTVDEIDFSGVNQNNFQTKDAIGMDIVKSNPSGPLYIYNAGLTFETFMAEIDEMRSLKEVIDRDGDLDVLDDIKFQIKGHLDIYKTLLEKDEAGYSAATKSIKNISCNQIKELIKTIHSTIFRYNSVYRPGTFRFPGDRLSVGNHFAVPNFEKFSQTKDKPIRAIQEVLRLKKSVPNSKYIDAAAKAYYKLYTQQLFHDGNSRTSKVLLNFLLLERNIPISLSSINRLKEERELATDEVGYDQRIREAQLAGAYEMKSIYGRVIGRRIIRMNHKDRYGNTIPDHPKFVFTDSSQVFEDRDAGIKGNWKSVLFNMTPLPLPADTADRLKHKEEECHGWQSLRTVDYTPIIRVIYKSILTTYVDQYLQEQLDKENIMR